MRSWLLIIARFGAVQMLVQGVGAVSSILLVRHLSKSDYALFIIANSMQGVMNLLADSGVSVALTAAGGKIWQDRRRLGDLVCTALYLRRRLAGVVALAVTPLLMYLLLRNGSGIVYAGALSAAVLVGFGYRLGLDVFIVVPRLHSQIARLQWLDLGASALRLALLAAFFGVLLNAGTAVWIATACLAWQAWLVRRWAREHLAPDAAVNADDRREVGTKIRQMLPSALFYCLQGQVVVFLLSLTGHSGQVAEVGALGRLTILLAVFAPVMNGVVLPAFSRCQVRARLVQRYWLVLGAFVLLGVGLVGAASLFADPLLWLLGPKYAGLRPLLVLLTLNTALDTLNGAMWSMNAAKGWVDYAWTEIPLRLLLQVALVFAFDLSTTSGAIWFSICSQSSPILVNSYLTFRGLRSLARA